VVCGQTIVDFEPRRAGADNVVCPTPDPFAKGVGADKEAVLLRMTTGASRRQ